MMEQIAKYFNGEKSESLLFVLVGVTAITLASYFLIKIKHPFYNGISYSLITIALIQLAVGINIYLRSPKDIARVNQLVQTDKAKIQTEEIPRMQKVMKNFSLIKWIEIVLIVTGILLYFLIHPMNVWKGVGVGLIIQAATMLIFDLFAESRGKVYLEYLFDIN